MSNTNPVRDAEVFDSTAQRLHEQPELSPELSALADLADNGEEGESSATFSGMVFLRTRHGRALTLKVILPNGSQVELTDSLQEQRPANPTIQVVSQGHTLVVRTDAERMYAQIDGTPLTPASRANEEQMRTLAHTIESRFAPQPSLMFINASELRGAAETLRQVLRIRRATRDVAALGTGGSAPIQASVDTSECPEAVAAGAAAFAACIPIVIRLTIALNALGPPWGPIFAAIAFIVGFIFCASFAASVYAATQSLLCCEVHCGTGCCRGGRVCVNPAQRLCAPPVPCGDGGACPANSNCVIEQSGRTVCCDEAQTCRSPANGQTECCGINQACRNGVCCAPCGSNGCCSDGEACNQQTGTCCPGGNNCDNLCCAPTAACTHDPVFGTPECCASQAQVCNATLETNPPTRVNCCQPGEQCIQGANITRCCPPNGPVLCGGRCSTSPDTCQTDFGPVCCAPGTFCTNVGAQRPRFMCL